VIALSAKEVENYCFSIFVFAFFGIWGCNQFKFFLKKSVANVWNYHFK